MSRSSAKQWEAKQGGEREEGQERGDVQQRLRGKYIISRRKGHTVQSKSCQPHEIKKNIYIYSSIVVASVMPFFLVGLDTQQRWRKSRRQLFTWAAVTLLDRPRNDCIAWCSICRLPEPNVAQDQCGHPGEGVDEEEGVKVPLQLL